MLTIKDIEHIADLANLELSEEEKKKLKGYLEEILEYIEKLKGLNTDEVEPSAYSLEQKNITRKDETKKSLDTKDAVSNAPETTRNFFRVPKIME